MKKKTLRGLLDQSNQMADALGCERNRLRDELFNAKHVLTFVANASCDLTLVAARALARKHLGLDEN